MTNNTTVLTGVEIELFRAKVLITALKLYMRTGMQANRAYTPKNMLLTATNITGKEFKARQYKEAIEALEAWCVEKELS